MFFLLVGVINDIFASFILLLKTALLLGLRKNSSDLLTFFSYSFSTANIKGCPFNYKEHFHFKKYFTLRM